MSLRRLHPKAQARDDSVSRGALLRELSRLYAAVEGDQRMRDQIRDLLFAEGLQPDVTGLVAGVRALAGRGAE